MNTTQLELQNRIKLLMEYDMKHTLSENHEMILEIGIPKWVGTLTKTVLDDVISNAGGVLKTLGDETVSTSDDLLKVLGRSGKNSLDDVSRELLRNSLLKNASVPIKQKGYLIKDLITNQVTINKYANNTNQEIFKKFQNAGYPDDVSQTIANKLKPIPKKQTIYGTVPGAKRNPSGKTNPPNQSQIDKANAAKLAKQRAENAKLLSKQLNDEVYQLEKIVADFENKTAKEVLKNPALKQKVREAKNFLDDIKIKDLSVLSKYKQTQLNSLEATIKNANPSVYSEITNFIGKGWAGFRRLHWGVQALGVVLLVKLFGGKETGQILRKIWNGTTSLGGDILRGMGILDPETTPGTTPDNNNGSVEDPDNGGEANW